MKWLLIILPFTTFAQVRRSIDGGGQVVRFDTMVRNCTIRNVIIEANPFIQIFDTSVTLMNCKTREFSTAWYGAKSTMEDAAPYLQKASDACIANNIANLFVADSYKTRTSWSLYSIYKGQYVGFALNVYGQGDMWNNRTSITYTGNWYAFGVQMAKGGSVRNLQILGNYQAPEYTGPAYYTTPFPLRGGYVGIMVDYDGSKNTGGSSGYTIEDTWVDGFDVLYAISQNSATYNADMIRLNHIRCGNGRIGVQSNQAQEKGNEINYISSWGRIHTLIQIGVAGKVQAGDYTIRGGNVAGGCVQLFDVSLAGWNSFAVYDLFAESLGRIGRILAGDSKYAPGATLNNLRVRFALKNAAGDQCLFTSNSPRVVFRGGFLWYYGDPGTMRYDGTFSMEACDLGSSTFKNGNVIVK